VLVYPSAPINGIVRVRLGDEVGIFVISKTLFIASSAILLYVVHFPPTTKNTPVLGLRLTTCSLDTGAPGGACGSVASGRKPRHALRTSDRRTCMWCLCVCVNMCVCVCVRERERERNVEKEDLS